MTTPNTVTQADGGGEAKELRHTCMADGVEKCAECVRIGVPEQVAKYNASHGVGQSYECSYCGVTYVKKDPRQVLCLRCTVEDYL